jgi:hypothetical protein
MLIHFLRFVFVLFFCFFSPVWKIPGPVGGGGDDAAAATAFFLFLSNRLPPPVRVQGRD